MQVRILGLLWSLAFLQPPVPQEKTKDYFPAPKGMEWVYEGSWRTRGDTTVVVGTEKVDDETWTIFETKSDDPARGDTWTYYRIQEAAVHLVATAPKGGKPLERLKEPLLLLKLPLKMGDKWKLTPDSKEPECSVDAPERVKTKAGEYLCMKVVSGDSAWWYAPDVGLVKSTRSLGSKSESNRTLTKVTSPPAK